MELKVKKIKHNKEEIIDMKKIIILLLMGSLVFTSVFAQEEEEQDISYFLGLLTDDDGNSVDFADIDLTEFVSTSELAALDDDDDDGVSYLDELETVLEEAGLSTEIIADTVAVVETIAEQASVVYDDPGYTEETDTFSITLDEAVEDTTEVDSLDTIESGISVYAADQILGGDEPLIDDDMQEMIDLAAAGLNSLTGFAQATAQASTSTSLFGYQGYKLFAASFGTTLSLAIDSDSQTSLIDILNNSEDIVEDLQVELEDNGFDVGFAMSGFTANVGINLGFLVDRLYAGVVFGMTNVDATSEDGISASVMGVDIPLDSLDYDLDVAGVELGLELKTLGITANYQLIKPIGIPILFRWNGLSLGSGLIMNTFNVSANADLGTLLADSMDDIEADDLDLNAEFSINSTTFTIPLEASTGVQLLSILTITAGAAVDIQFGESSVEFDITSDSPDSLITSVVQEALTQAFDGSIEVPYDLNGEVNFISPRVMAGIGVGLGPLVLDFSAIYYINSGATLGASFILRF